MFACTATQTCVVNILPARRSSARESADRRREGPSSGSIAREYRTLSSFRPVLLLFFCLSRRWRGDRSRRRRVSKPSRRLDRSIDRADRSTRLGSMDLVFVILKFVFFCFWKIRTFPRAESPRATRTRREFLFRNSYPRYASVGVPASNTSRAA